MITNKDLQKLSKLSRIDIRENEYQIFSNQISRIFEYIDKIKKYKFSENKPLIKTQKNQLRKDIAISSDTEDLILEFSNKENNLLKVNKVL